MNVGLNITRRCNLNCSHCYLKRANIEMEINFIKYILSKYKPTSVSLTGGEPFIHKKFGDILIEIVKFDYVKQIYIYTNGLLLYKYKNLLFSHSNKIKLIISLYGSTQIRKAFSSLDCSESSIPISINLVGYKQNLKLLNLINLTCNIQEIFLLYPLKFPHNKVDVIQPSEWFKIVNIYRSWIRNSNIKKTKFYYEKVFLNKNYEFDLLERILPPCKRKEDIFIDSDKNSYYCCLLTSFNEISFSKEECPVINFHKEFISENEYLMICPLLLFDENDIPYGEHSYAMESNA